MKSLLAAIVVTAVCLYALPEGYWEPEEIAFAHALVTFDPLQHRPAPPVHPLYVGLARLVYAFVHDAFLSQIVLAVVASAAGAALFARGAGELLGDAWGGFAASLLLHLSPAVVIFAPLPNAEAVALAALGAALLFYARGESLFFGMALGAAVGAQPRWIVAAMVWWAASAVVARRGALRSLAGLAAASAVCWLPVVETIGIGRIDDYLRYARESTAAIAGGGLSGAPLVMRFIAHPWGTKWIAVPLLVAAAAGLAVAVRQAELRMRVVPPLAFAATQLGCALAFADRGDGVQPVLGSLVAPALLAGLALARSGRLPATLVLAAFSIGFLLYVMPLLDVRRKRDSAPREVLAKAVATLPGGSVLATDPPLTIHARAFAPSLRPVSLQYVDRWTARTEVPLFLLTDGGSKLPAAFTAEWPDSDPYGKLTTERYRVASIIPLAAHRYSPGEGVHQIEEDEAEGVWRWLAPRAWIGIPSNRGIVIEIGLPRDAPIERNRVTINGVALEVRRGERTVIDLPPSRRVTFESVGAFTPPGESRSLAVQLFRAEARR
ncbi:MAG TPA: hypothetical protein VNL91_11810 [Thermoanaerobaculia bacterium]|nr:hypothetical protein [Thermoanaerobaculia bacterium]